MKKFLTHHEIDIACQSLAHGLLSDMPQKKRLRLYPVPRGGVPIAYALLKYMPAGTAIVQSPEEANIIVDDLVDSGRTAERYNSRFPDKIFAAAFEKSAECNDWLVFPWEVSEEKSIEDSFVRLFQYIGEDPMRGGLLETPARMAKAWTQWTSGYDRKPEDVLKQFEDGAENAEMVLVKDIPFYSHCEHHLAPFFGTVTIGYIPQGRIVGLSKLSRLTDIFARRLQVQERLTNQIADSIVEHLGALGVGVIIKARHMCMESRGVCQQGHHTVTSALRGVMRDQAATRSEFIELAK